MLEITTTTETSAVEKQLQDFKAEFENLEINGVGDRPGYKKIQDSAKTVRAYRLDLQKKAKAIDAQLSQIKKDFATNAGLIIAGFQELEESLRAKLEAIDREKNMAKEAEKAAELILFNMRTTDLFSAGFTFNGQNYIVGAVYISPDQIAAMPDHEFDEILKKGEAESIRIAELMQASFLKNAPGPGPEPESKIEAIPNPIQAPNIEPEIERRGIMLEWRAESPFDFQSPGTYKINRPQIPVLPEPPHFPHGFTMGFDACRNKVLQILASEEKFTRDQLRDLIIGLGYL